VLLACDTFNFEEVEPIEREAISKRRRLPTAQLHGVFECLREPDSAVVAVHEKEISTRIL
jgi:hypothetical protein